MASKRNLSVKILGASREARLTAKIEMVKSWWHNCAKDKRKGVAESDCCCIGSTQKAADSLWTSMRPKVIQV